MSPADQGESGRAETPAAAERAAQRRAVPRLAILPFLVGIYAYRILLGPWLGGHCRFHPTCSQYGLDAYRAHGPIRGSWLTLRRLARCHPFGGRGFDPVPGTQPAETVAHSDPAPGASEPRVRSRGKLGNATK